MSIHLNQSPRTITESSRNESNSAGHSHAIEKASVKQAGIVKLVDSLDSKSKTEALTANQGRELAERLSLLAQSNGSKESIIVLRAHYRTRLQAMSAIIDFSNFGCPCFL